jgi:hypothetical protein
LPQIGNNQSNRKSLNHLPRCCNVAALQCPIVLGSTRVPRVGFRVPRKRTLIFDCYSVYPPPRTTQKIQSGSHVADSPWREPRNQRYTQIKHQTSYIKHLADDLPASSSRRWAQLLSYGFASNWGSVSRALGNSRSNAEIRGALPARRRRQRPLPGCGVSRSPASVAISRIGAILLDV